jgi:hypothetical protein
VPITLELLQPEPLFPSTLSESMLSPFAAFSPARLAVCGLGTSRP